MKILLTAPPAMGKSTIISAVIKHFTPNCCGIVAREMLDDAGTRLGFTSVNDRGESRQFMFRTDESNQNSVGDFRVDIPAIDQFVVPSLQNALGSRRGCLIYVDEIGRAQLKSIAFLSIARAIFQSAHNVLATITYEDEPENVEFKRDLADCVLEVTRANRDALPKILISAFENAELFRALKPAQRKKLCALLTKFVASGNNVSATKIFTNAIHYVLEDRVKLEEQLQSKYQYRIAGKTREHQIVLDGESGVFSCDCDLSNGVNEYAGLPQPCSHQISILLSS